MQDYWLGLRVQGLGLGLRLEGFKVSGLGFRVGVTILRTMSRLEQVQGLGL